jgi:hypothetical protein
MSAYTFAYERFPRLSQQLAQQLAQQAAGGKAGESGPFTDAVA